MWYNDISINFDDREPPYSPDKCSLESMNDTIYRLWNKQTITTTTKTTMNAQNIKHDFSTGLKMLMWNVVQMYIKYTYKICIKYTYI